MVTPAQRRAWVRWVIETFRVSTRAACRATGVARSTIASRSRRPPQTAWRRRLRELAAARVSYGYQRLHTLLRREGWPVNRKRVYRLYREEGLQLRRTRPRRRRAAVARGPRPRASRPQQIWAMDFMHDTLADGRRIRVLTLIDSYTRVCLALEARTRFGGADVVETLEEMQKDLDVYLANYSRKRPHRGRGMEGRTPYQVFKAGLQKAKQAAKTRTAGKEEKQAA
jgi:putative transposase